MPPGFKCRIRLPPTWILPWESPLDGSFSSISIKASCFLFRRKLISELGGNNVHLKPVSQKAPCVPDPRTSVPSAERGRLDVGKGCSQDPRAELLGEKR